MNLQKKYFLKEYTIYLLLLGFWALASLTTQAQNTTLATQEQVNNFESTLGGSTVFTGNLTIKSSPSSDITDLSPLNFLTEIGGFFELRQNEGLQNMGNFSNLRKIGGRFLIFDHTALETVSGFSVLDTLGGAFQIIENNRLTDLGDYPSLRYIGGDFIIGDIDSDNDRVNYALTDVGNFPVLTTLLGNFNIYKADKLKAFSGFPSLDTLAGYFEITDNEKLEDLGDYSSLRYIGGDFIIGDAHDTKGNRENPLLTDIGNFPLLTTLLGNFNIYRSNSLKFFSGFPSLDTLAGRFVIANNEKLEDLGNYAALRHIAGYVLVNNNPELTTLSDFNRLERVGGYFLIRSNAKLKSIGLFPRLTTFGEYFSVRNNDNFQYMHDFPVLTRVGGVADGDSTWVPSQGLFVGDASIIVEGNPLLASCCALTKLRTHDEIDEDFISVSERIYIHGNATGCSSVSDVNCNAFSGAVTDDVQVSFNSTDTVVTVVVKTPNSWQLSKPADATWITKMSALGDTSNTNTLTVAGDGTFQSISVGLTYEVVPTSTPRSAVLTFTQLDAEGNVVDASSPMTFTLTQAGFPPYTGEDIEIVNLEQLNNIRNRLGRSTIIKGNLSITLAGGITNLDPLHFLTEITGYFLIGNPSNGNPDLVDIGTFPFLRKIGGNYRVAKNAKLVYGGHFPVLDSIGGYFFILGNDKLEHVGSFPSLVDIGGYISIRSNNSLRHLYEFPALSTIRGGNAYVPRPPSGDARNIADAKVVIQQNSSLEYCCVLAGNAIRSLSSNNVFASHNASGCNSVSEVNCNPFAMLVMPVDTFPLLFHTTDITFTILSNTRWRLSKPSADADWVTMLSVGEEIHSDSIVGGQNGELMYTSVRVRYQPNGMDTSRTADLFLSFLDEMEVATPTDTFTLRQEERQEVLQLVSSNSVNVSHSAVSTELRILSNVRWQLRKPEEATWITRLSDGTTSNTNTLPIDKSNVEISEVTTVTITHEIAPNSNSRTVMLTLVAVDAEGNERADIVPHTITVTQAGFPAFERDFTLTTQAEVNAFRDMLGDPRVTSLMGHLTIGPSTNITDLSPLNFLTEIQGNFSIGRTTTGSGNSALVNIGDFPVLENIRGYFLIRNNHNLVNIGDFPALERIGCYYDTYNNRKLENMGDFPALESIGEYFQIFANSRLEDMGSFPSLTTIGQYFNIRRNERLIYVYDFPALTSIGKGIGAYQMTENTPRTDLNLNIAIQYNASLKYCCILENFRSGGMYRGSGNVRVDHNAAGCNTASGATCGPSVEFSIDTLMLPFYSTDTAFTLSSNTRWRLHDPGVDWITTFSGGVDSLTAGGFLAGSDSSLRVNYQTNLTSVAREVGLLVSSLDSMDMPTPADTLTLIQEENREFFELQSPTVLNVSHLAGNVKIRFRSNVRWSLNKPADATWTTLSIRNESSNTNLDEGDIGFPATRVNEVTITYEVLPTAEPRSVELVLKSFDGSSITMSSDTLTLTQAIPPHRGSITLRNQAQVDTIRATLGNDPRITVIAGNLTIGPSSDITHLDSLRFLTEITGSFTLGINATNGGNAALVNAGDFPALERVGGDFRILRNHKLESVGDFPVLERIGDNFYINVNLELESVGDFSALERVGGEFRVSTNRKLENVGTYPSLVEIGYFNIIFNNSLRYLYDFPALEIIRMGGAFDPVLGVNQRAKVGIVSNPLLRYCCVLLGNTELSLPSDSVSISGNATGCNSISEVTCGPSVEFSSDTLMVPFYSTDTAFSIVANTRWRLHNPGVDWIETFSVSEESPQDSVTAGRFLAGTETPIQVNYQQNATSAAREVGWLVSSLDSMDVATPADTLVFIQEGSREFFELISPTVLKASHLAGNMKIRFRSNVGWRLSRASNNWIRLALDDGSSANTVLQGSDTEFPETRVHVITVSYGVLPTEAPRSVELTLEATAGDNRTLASHTITLTQAIPPYRGDIVLENQAQVDTIRATLGGDPRITAIAGRLTIGSSSDITHLDSLRFLTEVTGSFTIQNNANLEDVGDFPVLERVGDNFVIRNNANLEDAGDFPALERIGFYFEINNNDNLPGTGNFPELKRVEGNFTIANNANLEDVGDFPKLERIGRNVFIGNNDNSQGAGNYPELDSIGGYFFIDGNRKLENVGTFSSLVDIGTYFSIRNNPILRYLYDFPALRRIRGGGAHVPYAGGTNSAAKVVINNNPLLEYCCVLLGNTVGLSLSSDSVFVRNNATGCNSVGEANCNGFVDVLQVDDTLQVPFFTTDATFTIAANTRWQLHKSSADAAWITMLSAGEESHSDTILGGELTKLTFTSVTVNYDLNDDTSRSVNLFLSSLDEMGVATPLDSFVFRQGSGRELLQLESSDVLEASESAGSTEIVIRSNVRWRLRKPSDATWMTFAADNTTASEGNLIGDDSEIGVRVTAVTVAYGELPTSASRNISLFLEAIDEDGAVRDDLPSDTLMFTQVVSPYVGDITLTTQAEVDNILDTLGDRRITAISGNLIIVSSTDITHLDSLRFLTEIGGNFFIGNVNRGNAELVEIGNFPVLRKVGGDYYVTENPKLIDGGNFPVLESIGGYFFIRVNEKLARVGSFPVLKDIGTFISIRSNNSMPYLYDFPALTSIGFGRAWVPSNNDFVNAASIIVERNDALQYCCVLTKFRSGGTYPVSGSVHAAGNATGCDDVDDLNCNPFASLSEGNTFTLPFVSSSFNFTISTNRRWRLSQLGSEADWVTFSVGGTDLSNDFIGGTDSILTRTSVGVGYSQNELEEARSVRFSLNLVDGMGNVLPSFVPDTLTFLQEGNQSPRLSLTSPAEVAIAHGSATPVTIMFDVGGAAMGWTSEIAYSSGESFIMLSKTTGTETMGSVTIVATPSANLGVERTATLTFTPTGVIGSPVPATLTITQGAAPNTPMLSLTSHEDGEEIAIAHGSATPVTIMFDVGGTATGWSAGVGDASFLTLSATSGDKETGITITATPSVNTGVERTETLTLRTIGGVGMVTRTLTFVQEASPNAPRLSFTSHTDGGSVPIAHDNLAPITIVFDVGGGATGWSSEINYTPANANFITLSETSHADATGSVTITATPLANTGAERMATLTLSSMGGVGTATRTLTILQRASPNAPTLSLTSHTGGGNISVTHINPSFAITFDVGGAATGWTSALNYSPSGTNFITLSKTTGTDTMGSVTIMATPAANTGVERTATLTIKTVGPESTTTPATVTLTITQKGGVPTLTLSTNSVDIASTSTTPISITFDVGGGATGWSASAESGSFITLSKRNGDAGTGMTITATPTANTEVERTATITLTTTGGAGTAATATFTITQAANTALGVSVSKPFTLYPNPTDGTLTIEGVSGDVYIDIYNLEGKEVATYPLTFPTRIIDISSLPSGTYLVTVRGMLNGQWIVVN